MVDRADFSGKAVLITGAGRGVGREVALAFASLGAQVAANDINPISLDETLAQVSRLGGTARGYVFDVAKRMPIEAMVSQVMEQCGHIDILVNHATVKPVAPILDMDEWEFHRTLDVNLGGPFFCMQQVGRVMRQQGGGVMVNLISSFEPGNPLLGHSAHLASLAGLVGLTRTVAGELSAYHIRLNAVCQAVNECLPASASVVDEAAYYRWRASAPALPPGDQIDLVSLVLFLCTDAAASTTGQVLFPPTAGDDY